MKNFNILYFFIFTAFTLLSSCLEPIGSGQAVIPVEATAIITDGKEQALKNRLVSASGYGLSRITGLTDENGHVHFNFLWYVYNESGPAIWVIQPVEDTIFKMVNLMVTPGDGGIGGSSKLTIRDSLKMDSLTSFKVRVKTTRTDVNFLSLSVLHEGMNPLPDPIKGYEYWGNAERTPHIIGQNSNFIIRQKRKQVFLEHRKTTNTPQLDTTFQMKVFANTPFTVDCYMTYKTAPMGSVILKRTISATASRDSVLLLQF